MQVLAEAERAKWGGGQASGAIYNGNEDHMANSTQAYRLFSHSNPLHPDLWPSGLKFESEVIDEYSSRTVVNFCSREPDVEV